VLDASPVVLSVMRFVEKKIIATELAQNLLNHGAMKMLLNFDTKGRGSQRYNTNICDYLTQEPRTVASPATAAAVGARRPPRLNRRVLLNRHNLTYIKGRKK
jgi:hypothetical protein